MSIAIKAIYLISNVKITTLLLPIGIVVSSIAIFASVSRIVNHYIKLDELPIDKHNTTTIHEFKVETIKKAPFPFDDNDVILQGVEVSNNHPEQKS